jgi:hypothetical protein
MGEALISQNPAMGKVSTVSSYQELLRAPEGTQHAKGISTILRGSSNLTGQLQEVWKAIPYHLNLPGQTNFLLKHQ